jgi:MFS family permease
VDAIHLRPHELTWQIRLRRQWRYLAFVIARTRHHVRTAPGVVWGALRWTWPDFDLSPQYWRFFVAAGLYDFGMFIYFLLYSLYLLQLGYKEDTLGLVSSTMLAGSIAGSLPAAALLQRYGLKSAVTACFVFVAGIAALRAAVSVRPLILCLAFAAGFGGSMWAVAISPAVAQLTNDRSRSLGFSLIFSSGIAIGVFGGAAAGYLPHLFAQIFPSGAATWHYRGALWIGSALTLAALLPLRNLALAGHEQQAVRFIRPNPTLKRFLIAGAVWNLGTGAFNPFFSAYFTRLHVPVQNIGLIVSLSQLAQAAAVIAAPLLLRRLGLVRGISSMQVLTAVALILIALAGGPVGASVGYGAYMVCEYMTEPGFYTLLMDCVKTDQRSEASALNFLVSSLTQALAALLAGYGIQKFGYAAVLTAAAVVCAIAGILFQMLLGSSVRSWSADTDRC